MYSVLPICVQFYPSVPNYSFKTINWYGSTIKRTIKVNWYGMISHIVTQW